MARLCLSPNLPCMFTSSCRTSLNCGDANLAGYIWTWALTTKPCFQLLSTVCLLNQCLDVLTKLPSSTPSTEATAHRASQREYGRSNKEYGTLFLWLWGFVSKIWWHTDTDWTGSSIDSIYKCIQRTRIMKNEYYKHQLILQRQIQAPAQLQN